MYRERTDGENQKLKPEFDTTSSCSRFVHGPGEATGLAPKVLCLGKVFLSTTFECILDPLFLLLLSPKIVFGK